MVQNNLVLPSTDSNFGISIRDRNGQQIPIREPFPLANFSATQSHIDLPLSATLVPIGTPKIGPFTAVVIVQILYD
jgi:major type 1 subunit fimbrin (pilin)